MLLFLQPDELSELTGKVRSSAQVVALRRMGIDHRVRPDGRVLVLRSQVDGSASESRRVTKTEPRYDTINAKTAPRHQLRLP